MELLAASRYLVKLREDVVELALVHVTDTMVYVKFVLSVKMTRCTNCCSLAAYSCISVILSFSEYVWSYGLRNI